MKMEIERKFLVLQEELPALGPGSNILQGYLSRRPMVRVRRVKGPDSKTGWLTIKGKGNVSRPEYEYEIPYKDAKEMLALCECTIEKVRRKITYMGNVWELDEFLGPHEGLWLAEIELTSEGDKFQKPSWVGREVSEDPRYTNASLAEMRRAP